MSAIKHVLCNAFSMNMLPVGERMGNIVWRRRELGEIQDRVHSWGFESAVGHPDTARILADKLHVEVPCNRVNVILESGTVYIVAQYIGPRLPEGATSLPEGARIEWFTVEVG